MRWFEKVCNEKTSFSFELDDRDVSEWDVVGKQWVIVKGLFDVYVGSSSQDIRLKGTVTVL